MMTRTLEKEGENATFHTQWWKIIVGCIKRLVDSRFNSLYGYIYSKLVILKNRVTIILRQQLTLPYLC